MTSTDEALILKWVAEPKYKTLPGMPITAVPLDMKAALQNLIHTGALEVINIDKPSKVTEGEFMTYTYLRKAARV